jgi:hypothetical protein
MRVRYRDVLKTCPSEAVFATPAQVFLSTGKEYDVHAVSVYNGIVFLQIVDDGQMPELLPRSLFEVVDSSVPDDWICNAFPEGPVQLLLGPAFFADSPASYDGMIDRDAKQVGAFWQRVGYRGPSSRRDE